MPRARLTVETPLGPVTLVEDAQGRARPASELDAERWARLGERISAAIVSAQVPRSRWKLSLRELRALPSKRRRQTSAASARAADKRKAALAAKDEADRPRVKRMVRDGKGAPTIARELHISPKRVRRLRDE